jgi:hypothetical protein
MITLPSLAIGGVFRMFRKSLVAQIIAGAVAFSAIWYGNNIYQRSIGESRGIAKVVKKSNAVAKKRDAKIQKRTGNIDPGSAGKRLLDTYARTD